MDNQPTERVYLEEYLAEAGYESLNHLAKVNGWEPETVRDWAMGLRFPRQKQMFQLRNTLGVPVDLLLGFAGEPIKKQKKQFRLTPEMIHARRMLNAVTNNFKFNSDALLEMSLAFRKLVNRPNTPFEIYIRELAIALAHIEAAGGGKLKHEKTNKNEPSYQQLQLRLK